MRINHVATAEPAETSSGGFSAPVLRGQLDPGARPTLTNAYLCRVGTVEPATILLADSVAVVVRVLPVVSARRTLTSVFRGRALGPVPLNAYSVIRAMDICVSVWTAGREPDARRALIAVVTIRAATAVAVWNCRLRVCADVHRYANIVFCCCVAFQILCFINFSATFRTFLLTVFVLFVLIYELSLLRCHVAY